VQVQGPTVQQRAILDEQAAFHADSTVTGCRPRAKHVCTGRTKLAIPMADPAWSLPLRIRWDEELSLLDGDGALPGCPPPIPGMRWRSRSASTRGAPARSTPARARAAGWNSSAPPRSHQHCHAGSGWEWRPPETSSRRGCTTSARFSKARRRCRSPGCPARSARAPQPALQRQDGRADARPERGPLGAGPAPAHHRPSGDPHPRANAVDAERVWPGRLRSRWIPGRSPT
jgi:hypothetical protein